LKNRKSNKTTPREKKTNVEIRKPGFGGRLLSSCRAGGGHLNVDEVLHLSSVKKRKNSGDGRVKKKQRGGCRFTGVLPITGRKNTRRWT